MALSFTQIPSRTQYTFKRGDTHIGVWALQRFLGNVTDDGVFGPVTETAVKRWQSAHALLVDGIVGPATQRAIVEILDGEFRGSTPAHLVSGLIGSESGDLLAAVNNRVPGGIDCGLTQRRVYGPPYAASRVRAAFDPAVNVRESVQAIVGKYTLFSGRVGKGEYAWRLAALAHNWPYGADTLSRGRHLSLRTASWAVGTRFADGEPVTTYADWARFYATGSHAHRHAGLVTGAAFGIPKVDL